MFVVLALVLLSMKVNHPLKLIFIWSLGLFLYLVYLGNHLFFLMVLLPLLLFVSGIYLLMVYFMGFSSFLPGVSNSWFFLFLAKNLGSYLLWHNLSSSWLITFFPWFIIFYMFFLFFFLLFLINLLVVRSSRSRSVGSSICSFKNFHKDNYQPLGLINLLFLSFFIYLFNQNNGLFFLLEPLPLLILVRVVFPFFFKLFLNISFSLVENFLVSTNSYHALAPVGQEVMHLAMTQGSSKSKKKSGLKLALASQEDPMFSERYLVFKYPYYLVIRVTGNIKSDQHSVWNFYFSLLFFFISKVHYVSEKAKSFSSKLTVNSLEKEGAWLDSMVRKTRFGVFKEWEENFYIFEDCHKQFKKDKNLFNLSVLSILIPAAIMLSHSVYFFKDGTNFKPWESFSSDNFFKFKLPDLEPLSSPTKESLVLPWTGKLFHLGALGCHFKVTDSPYPNFVGHLMLGVRLFLDQNRELVDTPSLVSVQEVLIFFNSVVARSDFSLLSSSLSTLELKVFLETLESIKLSEKKLSIGVDFFRVTHSSLINRTLVFYKKRGVLF